MISSAPTDLAGLQNPLYGPLWSLGRVGSLVKATAHSAPLMLQFLVRMHSPQSLTLTGGKMNFR